MRELSDDLCSVVVSDCESFLQSLPLPRSLVRPLAESLSLGFDFVTATPSGDVWVVGAFGTILKRLSAVTPGDADGDGIVGILDLLAVLGAWGSCSDPCPPTCLADFDGDCSVGILDLLILLANWS